MFFSFNSEDSQQYSQKTPHSSPLRVSYGVSLGVQKSDKHYPFVVVML